MDEQIAKKIEQFFLHHKDLFFKKGEIIIRADDNPQGIFYLVSGAVRMYAVSHKGDELVLTIFKPISFFPMNWAINETQNKYYFEAITDVTVRRAPKDEVLTFLKANPDVLYNLLSRLYKGIDGMLTRMTYLMAGSAYTRLITELLIYARRFGANDNGKTVISIKEEELATMTGMARETVSRMISIMKEKKLITYSQGTCVIDNLKKLEDEILT